jgi:hypothetical protein
MATLGVLFLTFDGVIKLVGHPSVAESSLQLGMPEGLAFTLGVLELVLLALYLVPRTAILGALLWTGYLGGAVFAQVRVGNPLFSHVLFSTYIATLLWVPLYLREPRLRALLPLRKD